MRRTDPGFRRGDGDMGIIHGDRHQFDWLVLNYEIAKLLLVVSDIAAIIMVAVGILVLHKRIAIEIERLRVL